MSEQGGEEYTMLYELINPSDKYTFEAETPLVAALTAFYVGAGQYGIRRVGQDHESAMKEFGWIMFASKETIAEKLGTPASEWLGEVSNRAALLKSLRSFVIGDRAEYERQRQALPAETQTEVGFLAFWEGWHDSHRSSMNDIGHHALKLADYLETGKGPRPRAWPVVFRS